MIAACFHDDYIPIDRGMLTIVSQIPLLLTLIFFGLLLGCLLNSGAPGTCAIILCFAAILGGSV
ncbi:MAG: hypothetical protein HUJ68_11315 [Clostridia bacterium]|nr:hypothetical protein [Clostridia bacterium]